MPSNFVYVTICFRSLYIVSETHITRVPVRKIGIYGTAMSLNIPFLSL